MIRINLLPHREEAKKARREQFFVLAGLVSILGALIVFAGYTLISTAISNQEGSNEFLKREIAVLDKQLDQIKRLKELRASRDEAAVQKALAAITERVERGDSGQTVGIVR